MSAVEVGHARLKEGAIGHGDPRKLKDYLYDKGFTTWLDIEKTGQVGYLGINLIFVTYMMCLQTTDNRGNHSANFTLLIDMYQMLASL